MECNTCHMVRLAFHLEGDQSHISWEKNVMAQRGKMNGAVRSLFLDLGNSEAANGSRCCCTKDVAKPSQTSNAVNIYLHSGALTAVKAGRR